MFCFSTLVFWICLHLNLYFNSGVLYSLKPCRNISLWEISNTLAYRWWNTTCFVQQKTFWFFQKVLWNWDSHYVRVFDWQNICHMLLLVFKQEISIPMGTKCTPLSQSFPNSWIITVFVTNITRQLPCVQQELPTLPDHIITFPILCSFPVGWCLVACNVLYINVFLFLLLAIVLSVLVRFKNLYYRFECMLSINLV